MLKVSVGLKTDAPGKLTVSPDSNTLLHCVPDTVYATSMVWAKTDTLQNRAMKTNANSNNLVAFLLIKKFGLTKK